MVIVIWWHEGFIILGTTMSDKKYEGSQDQ